MSNLKNIKISIKYTFGRKSKQGNRHFSILNFVYGKEGFLISLLGVCVIINY